MNLLILAANGQIARIIEKRVLSEPQFSNIKLTLGVRNHNQLADIASNERVTVAQVDLNDKSSIDAVMANQNVVFVGVIDHSQGNVFTKNVVASMKEHSVTRILFSSLLGLYDEVPGEYGRWNKAQVGASMNSAITADQLLAASGLDYTTLRFPWMNNRDEVKYTVTTKNEPYFGVSASRKSLADLVLKIVEDPTLYSQDSIGMANPDTAGETRPVY